MLWLRKLLLGEDNRIGRRLIVHIVVFSSLITLCLSMVQLAFEYRSLRDALDLQLDSARIYAPSIAGSVWDFDQKQVQRALNALVLLPNITQASVVTSDRLTQWRVGAQRPANEVTRSYALYHEVRGKETEIGNLTVVASLDGIYRQVVTSAISIILGNGLKTFLVALFMAYLIRRVVTVRLEKMAAKVHALIPGQQALRQVVDMAPEPLPATLDELDAVDWTLDRMSADLGLAVAALSRLNSELEQRVQERTQELEAFSYSVSHDLRTPLRAIDGFSRIVMEDYEDKLDAEGRRLLQVVRTNTARMGQLIDDILAFSRAGRREMGRASVDMARLVRSTFDDLQTSFAPRNVQLAIGVLPPAHGDASMIRQLLENLLTNAIKFTRPRAAALITVAGTVEDGECVYCIQDNGVGFDMRYVDKLFNVFERLHSRDNFEGTGIGLAIVKRIVVRHGGRVWAEGKPDTGTAIRFTLPRDHGQ